MKCLPRYTPFSSNTNARSNGLCSISCIAFGSMCLFSDRQQDISFHPLDFKTFYAETRRARSNKSRTLQAPRLRVRFLAQPNGTLQPATVLSISGLMLNEPLNIHAHGVFIIQRGFPSQQAISLFRRDEPSFEIPLPILDKGQLGFLPEDFLDCFHISGLR